MNARFVKECNDNEHFEIVDFCSLYPYVISKYDFMTGHPKVIRRNFGDYLDPSCSEFKKSLFGFVRCKVLPPKRMMFPILPMRFSERLEFVLCSTCAVTKNKTFCEHSDDERCLLGTFTTVELEEAMRNGYRVQDVYEILHWERKSDRLFSEFVRKWIKVKTEASGYPDNVVTESDKDAYVMNYYHETCVNSSSTSGILLDKDEIRKDPIRRNIAKNMLNSFYGKFAQRQNMETTEIVKDYAKMWEIACDESKIVTGMITIELNSMLVNWKLKNENDDTRQGNVNLAIAAFITSYARIELWRKINEVETESPGCVHYFDTDSIFYVAHDGMNLLRTGHNLGDLTREIPVDVEVKRATFLGPKNYAYVKRNIESGMEETIVKVKGITLHAQALQTLTFERMTEMAKAYCEQGITLVELIKQYRIHSRKDQIVMNITLNKIYRAVSEKRLIVGNTTFPIGYVRNELDAAVALNFDYMISILEEYMNEGTSQ